MLYKAWFSFFVFEAQILRKVGMYSSPCIIWFALTDYIIIKIFKGDNYESKFGV